MAKNFFFLCFSSNESILRFIKKVCPAYLHHSLLFLMGTFSVYFLLYVTSKWATCQKLLLCINATVQFKIIENRSRLKQEKKKHVIKCSFFSHVTVTPTHHYLHQLHHRNARCLFKPCLLFLSSAPQVNGPYHPAHSSGLWRWIRPIWLKTAERRQPPVKQTPFENEMLPVWSDLVTSPTHIGSAAEGNSAFVLSLVEKRRKWTVAAHTQQLLEQ